MTEAFKAGLERDRARAQIGPLVGQLNDLTRAFAHAKSAGLDVQQTFGREVLQELQAAWNRFATKAGLGE